MMILGHRGPLPHPVTAHLEPPGSFTSSSRKLGCSPDSEQGSLGSLGPAFSGRRNVSLASVWETSLGVGH